MNVKTLSIVAGLIAAFANTAALAADEYIANQNMPAAAVSTSPHVAVRVGEIDAYRSNRNYPTVVSSELPRAQVSAEAKEARRLGLIAEGERHVPTPTVAQAEQIRQAGLNAVKHQVAAR